MQMVLHIVTIAEPSRSNMNGLSRDTGCTMTVLLRAVSIVLLAKVLYEKVGGGERGNGDRPTDEM